MKYTLPILAAAGLGNAFSTSYLTARSIGDFDSQISLIARAIEDLDAQMLAAREAEPVGSRRGSTASAHEMQPLSRTSSWGSMHAETDAHGHKQESGNSRAEGDMRAPSRTTQAQNAAQRTVSYARKNPLEATSSTLSGVGSVLGAAGAINGVAGNAAGAAGCGAGAACFNGAANLVDKYRNGKKTASGKSKRDLMARALMAEIAMADAGFPEIEARGYYDDAELWAEDYYY